MHKKTIYRLISMTIAMPMITNTLAPTVPPTVTDRLSDEGGEFIYFVVSGEKEYWFLWNFTVKDIFLDI